MARNETMAKQQQVPGVGEASAPPSALMQARILAEALPHMQRYDRQTVVVKYGGHAMGDRPWRRPSPRTSCSSSRRA